MCASGAIMGGDGHVVVLGMCREGRCWCVWIYFATVVWMWGDVF